MDTAELREIFEFFDGDGNGIIDKSEFVKLMGALGAQMSPEECELGFGVIDTDKNGTIDFGEFAQWWASQG